MKQKVAVITINYNGTKDTLECLDSLHRAQKHFEFDPIVVEYTGKKGESELANHSMQPMIIKSQQNLGFAGFNNLALQTVVDTKYTHFVLLNNDATVSPHFLEPLIQSLSDSTIAFASPKIYFYPGCEFHSDYPKEYVGKVFWYAGGVIDWQNMMLFHRGVDEVDRGQFDLPIPTDFTTGCAVAFSRKTLETVGLMPKKYFMYYEDAVWSQRAYKKGLMSYYIPESVVYHKNASSTQGSGSALQQQYQTSNLLRFAREFAPVRTKIALTKNYLLKSFSGNLAQKKLYQGALINQFGQQKLVS